MMFQILDASEYIIQINIDKVVKKSQLIREYYN